ncbi:hypothetical protein BDW62DRAFT_206319 [Aspergillus aurantiobrunneus]
MPRGSSSSIHPGPRRPSNSSTRLQQAGLLYTQLYSSVKEVFAAGDVYLFSNPSLETLALDPQLHKTWQLVGRGLSYNPVTLVQVYLNIKQRCHAALQGSYIKVFGLHEEYWILFPLYHAIDQEFQEYNLYQSRLPGILSGQELLYSLLTSTLLFWIYWNVNKFCIGFKMVYSLNNCYFIT